MRRTAGHGIARARATTGTGRVGWARLCQYCPPPPPNSLYYGDCYDWMRQWPHESVDLIYLDPPFNSNANYNILFGKGNGVSAQMRGFTDTWKWNEAAAERVGRIEKATANPVHDATMAFRRLLGESGMLAYLTYMGERLAVMRDLLSPTGSIYLHCDDTAGSYLRVLMDSVFGADRFRNEVIWKRTSGHSDAKRFGRVHDVLLLYSGKSGVWNGAYEPLDDEYIEKHYRHEDSRGRYQADNLSAKGLTGGGYEYEFKGHHGPWRFPEHRMRELEDDDRIHMPRKVGGVPRIKRYLADSKGKAASDVITDIPNVGAWSKEKLDYPTQKPTKLLRRLLEASSNPGDLVLDPFCGCGTTIVAAHSLGRRWLGIDISPIAIDLINTQRLRPLGIETRAHGIPQDLTGARQLAADQPLKFEEWAVTRIDGLVPNERQVGDSGIDGRGRMLARPDTHDSDLVLAQVTGAQGFNLGKFRDFLHVVERENAAAGVYVTLDRRGTDAALAEARGKGEIVVGASRYPRVQVWSIADYFDGRTPQLPTLADPYTGKAVQPRLG